MASKDWPSRPLCSNVTAQVVSVGGMHERWVENGAWRLFSFIHDIKESQRNSQKNRFIGVTNLSGMLWSVSDQNVEQLHDILWNMSECQEGITCVIFAHSHGVKIVHHALSEAEITQFLSKKPVSDIEKWIRQRRKNLAIICIGGIEDISEDYAEVTVNIRHYRDEKARFGTFRYASREQRKCRKILFDGDRIVQESVADIGWKSKLSDLWSCTRPPLDGENHGLEDYLAEKFVWEQILQLLQLESENKCGCLKEPEMQHPKE